MKIHEIFEKIEHAAGMSDKMTIMQQNLNETVKQIYLDCYDPQVKYGVHKFEINNFGSNTIDNDYSKFHSILQELANRNLTGNAAISAVVSCIESFVKEDQQILKSILNKKLTIGFSFTSFKKLTGLTSSKPFEVTLACHLENVKDVNPVDGTWFASRKIDGCVAGNTMVELDNGAKLLISEIVDKRIKGKIKSYDEKTDTIVYRDIVDWMHNIEDVNSTNKQWYKIELINGRTLTITGNDSLYVKNKGWVKVEDLTENDELYIE